MKFSQPGFGLSLGLQLAPGSGSTAVGLDKPNLAVCAEGKHRAAVGLAGTLLASGPCCLGEDGFRCTWLQLFAAGPPDGVIRVGFVTGGSPVAFHVCMNGERLSFIALLSNTRLGSNTLLWLSCCPVTSMISLMSSCCGSTIRKLCAS